MKKIIINANQNEEIRVALLHNNVLENLDIERTQRKRTKTNIYKGTVKRIERSLEAAFVDYGSTKHGFLSFKEIAPSADSQPSTPEQPIHVPATETQILIQINKEERGNKGAALSTYISLAGCYLVLMPNTPKAGGISRRVQGNQRDQLKDLLNQLTVPDGMSIILRTAAVDKTLKDLNWDLNVLIKQWEKIKEASAHCKSPALIYDENNILIRTLKDNLHQGIDEIIVDNQETFEQVHEYVNLLTPEKSNTVTLYEEQAPIFNYYNIEQQIKAAFSKEIRLPSGGSIVIDKTEALTSIDINSAKSTRGTNIEETAVNTNIEAAKEICKQLKLRDIGGLIVIDFIDMGEKNNRDRVEEKIKQSIRYDKARIQIESISKFGLLEMSRQRLGSSLYEINQESCPYCLGQGIVRNIESVGLSLLREIENGCLSNKPEEILVHLPLELHAFLCNEKRNELVRLENNYKTKVLLIPSKFLAFPLYEINIKQTVSVNKTYQLIEKSSREKKLLTELSKSVHAPIVKVDHVLSKDKNSSNWVDNLFQKIGAIFSKKENTDKNKKGGKQSKHTATQNKKYQNNKRKKYHTKYNSSKNKKKETSGGAKNKASHNKSINTNKDSNQNKKNATKTTHQRKAAIQILDETKTAAPLVNSEKNNLQIAE